MPEAITIGGVPAVTKPRFDTMLRVISPDRLISAEKAEAEKRRAEMEQNRPVIQDLAAHLRGLWQAAYQAKMSSGAELGSPEDRLLRCLRQRLGQYDPDILAEITRQGRSDVYMLLTNIKCRAAQSWIEDVMLQPNEPVFKVDPTPIPELPQGEEAKIAEVVFLETQELMTAGGIDTVSVDNVSDRVHELREKVQQEKFQRAQKSATAQGRKIEDEFQEGQFYQALKAFINDLCTFPAAFLKGPIVRRERRLTWVENGKGGWMPKIQPKFVRKYERSSPFNIYPSPGAKHIQDGYLFERHQLRQNDLLDMIGVPGFNERAIRAVLDSPPAKEWISVDLEQSQAYSRDDLNDPDPTIDALEFWGSLSGKMLREWGMSPKHIPDPAKQYSITAWIIGTWVICARINPHPLGRRPYYSTSYAPVPDSVWGSCPPELMKDVQRIANAAARAVVDNLGIASGPMVEVNMDRVEPGEDIESMYPWKIWKTKSDPTGAQGPAIQFYQPSPLTGDLWAIFEKASVQAGEQTGIPAFTHAGVGASKEAGDTASGMSMQINAAGKVLKGVVREIDNAVIKPAVRDHWTHIMLYDDDENKIGDINIVARASEHLIVAESLQLRRTEFMNMLMSSDILTQIVGMKGLAALLREQARGLKMPTDEVVPPKEAFEQPPAQPGPVPLPVPQGGSPQGPIQGEKLTLDGGKHGEAIRMAA